MIFLREYLYAYPSELQLRYQNSTNRCDTRFMYSTYVSFIYLSKLSDELSLHLHVCSLLEMLIYILWLLLHHFLWYLDLNCVCVLRCLSICAKQIIYDWYVYIYAAYIFHNKIVMFRWTLVGVEDQIRTLVPETSIQGHASHCIPRCSHVNACLWHQSPPVGCSGQNRASIH